MRKPLDSTLQMPRTVSRKEAVSRRVVPFFWGGAGDVVLWLRPKGDGTIFLGAPQKEDAQMYFPGARSNRFRLSILCSC